MTFAALPSLSSPELTMLTSAFNSDNPPCKSVSCLPCVRAAVRNSFCDLIAPRTPSKLMPNTAPALPIRISFAIAPASSPFAPASITSEIFSPVNDAPRKAVLRAMRLRQVAFAPSPLINLASPLLPSLSAVAKTSVFAAPSNARAKKPISFGFSLIDWLYPIML